MRTRSLRPSIVALLLSLTGCAEEPIVPRGDAGAGIDANVTTPDGGGTDGGEAVDSNVGVDPDAGELVDGCVPDCAGRECGSDACGGSCGDCVGTETCAPTGECVGTPLDCDDLPYDTDALLAELVGFGQHVEGGDPDNVYHVTNDDADGAGSLRVGLESDEDYWIVFDVGISSMVEIDLGDEAVRPLSNKTVDGRGRTIVIDGAIKIEEGTRNLVFADVAMTNSHGERCTQEADIVGIRGEGGATPATFDTRDIWFHHVELFEGGDGLIDIRGGSRITISWSHFRQHSKGFLLGMESAPELEDREMEVTFHHNFFDRISRRSPQLSKGRVHYFNNYQFQWWEFGAASLAGAQFLSENNVYEARPGSICGIPGIGCTDPAPCGDDDWQVSKIAVSNDWSTSNRGYVRSNGDLLLEGAMVGVNEPARVFTPSYPYALDVANAALSARVRAESGPRTTYCR